MAPDPELTARLLRSLTRRQLLVRSAQTAGLAAFGGLLAACGGSGESASTPTTAEAAGTTAPATTAAPETGATAEAATTQAELSGDIVMMNYPGWMGENTVANFEAAYPGVTVKEVEGLTSGAAAAVTQVQQNLGSYDMTLGGLVVGGHLDAAGLVQPVDLANIPNIANMPQLVRDAYPFGIPTDYGKVGIGYRKDLMEDEPTSWADVWALAPKYDGKFVFVNYDVDAFGAALLSLGYGVNSSDPGELEEAKQALIDIKPNLRAFLSTDVIKPMLQGSAVLTVDYDYDIAIAQAENPNVVWVAPEEGMPAYLDGWIALKDTDDLPEVEAFMNFLLDPENYADFINTTGSAYLMPDAERFIDPAIKDNPSLKFDEDAISRIDWQVFLGPEATKLRSQLWEEVKAA